MIQLYQTLDLRPIGIPQTLRLSQYDSDFEIIFELTNFDGTWILDTSTTAEVQGTKTDGHGYSADAVFDDQLKTVTIAGDVQMTAAAGRNVYEVVLFHDGDRLGSKNFVLDVERAALDAETTASDSKIKNFTEMVESAEDAAETATDAAETAEGAAAEAEAIATASEDYDVLSTYTGMDRTYNGVTFTWNKAAKTVNAVGTASAQAFANLYSDTANLIPGLVAGQVFQLIMDNSTNLALRIGWYAGGSSSIGAEAYFGPALIQIPANATGMYIRANVLKDVAVNETIHFKAFASSDKVQHLKPLTYYVKQIDLPADMAIEGCGNSTVLQVPTAETTAYAFKAQRGNTIKDIKIIGAGGADWTPDGTITAAHGIMVNTYGTGDAMRNRIQISGVDISGFSGGAIYFDSTGVNYDNSTNIVNAYLHNCNVGLYIPKKAEYNRVSNTQCSRCYWGCINNGGNNQFSACGFNGNNTALLMDATGITSPANDSHGAFVGCNFNHTHSFSDNTSLIAIDLIGQANGELFCGCTIAYGALRIQQSSGIVFDACNFLSDSTLTAAGGGVILFNGCVFRPASAVAPTVSGTAVVKYANCYKWDGTPFNPTA